MTAAMAMPPDIRPHVARYLQDGFDVVPIPPRQKGPQVRQWEQETFTLAAFGPANNVGIKLGAGGLADVDLDCPEAIAIAPTFLPETGFIYGRAGAPASHWFYRLDPAVVSIKLMDPAARTKADATLIELRCLAKAGTIGYQSVVPGSTHEDTGELIEFAPGATRIVANADAHDIQQAVHRIAAAALLARHFPGEKSGRHDAFLAIGNVLARAGWTAVDARQFVRGIYRSIWGAAADLSAADSEAADGFARLQTGRTMHGIPHLKSVFPGAVIDAALRWMSVDVALASPTTSPTAPTTTTATRSPFEADDAGSGGAVADTPTGAIRYSLNLHDTGNADRLVSAYGDKLLFCESRASFGVWTGAYWRLEKGLTVARIAEQVIRDEFAKAGKITDSDVRKTFIAHLNKSLSRSGIESMVEVSKRKVRAVDPADFDATPHLLNFDNGTLDLRSGVLKAHDPNDLITRCIPYEYDTAAECPTFHRFLQRIMGFRAGGDSEQNDRALRLIGYLRRLFGCALGGKPEKIVAILHGNGNNGKTTLLETIRAVLGGRQYAGQIQIESLMVKPGDASASNAINADLADLQGCRFVSASEPEKGMRFSAARVKYLTGLTEVKARYLRENPFTFQPTHKLFVDANDRPAVADPNDALWNRLKLIPFTVEIPTSEIDTSMGGKLLRERPGIMTWLVGGAMEYFAEGLQDIPEVSAATNEYRQESDRLRDFLADECTVGVGWVAVADLWTAYLDWERRNGVLVPLRKSDFDQRIQRLNCTPTKKHRGTVRAWAGISLRVGADVTPEPQGGGD